MCHTVGLVVKTCNMQIISVVTAFAMLFVMHCIELCQSRIE